MKNEEKERFKKVAISLSKYSISDSKENSFTANPRINFRAKNVSSNDDNSFEFENINEFIDCLHFIDEAAPKERLKTFAENLFKELDLSTEKISKLEIY